MLNPHPKQKEIILSDKRFKVIRAGRRGGKTALQAEELVFKAVSKTSSLFYIAPTMIQARAIVWETLRARLTGIADFNEQRLEIKIPSSDGGVSFIKVSGWENRENFRGLKADHIVFDELDTMRDFFIGWQEIFRPALTDTRGGATFIGTPKKENPNLRRLEKQADEDWACFVYRTEDNPYIAREELEKAQRELDSDTWRQEYLAEYVENTGALFGYTNLVDVFSNSVDKDGRKYLVVDVADDGMDKSIFSFWDGMEEYRREEFSGLNTESIIAQIRDYAATDRIPMSNVCVDAIGVGAAVASSSLLNGIIGYKSSYAAIRNEQSIISVINVHTLKDAPLVTEFANLRSQCVFKLAELVNNHKIASRVSGKLKEVIIEELATYQDASRGDGKRMATQKDDVKSLIGRSPDHSDTWIMRMYFLLVSNLPGHTERGADVDERIRNILQSRANLNRSVSTR